MVCDGIAGGISGADGGKSISERITNGVNEWAKATEENYEELANMLANTPGGKALKATSEKSTKEIYENGGPLMSFGQELGKELKNQDPVETVSKRNQSFVKIITNNPIVQGIKGFFE